MLTIQLDPATEQHLAELAKSQGVDPNELAQAVLSDFLEFHAMSPDSNDEWAEASIALAPEIFPDDAWTDR